MSVQNLKINTVRAECGGDIPNLHPETAELLSLPDHYPSRNYGVDLLRIVSMFMVCILHVLGCGGVLSASEGKTIAFGIAWFLEIFAYCAVDIYALISGYVGFGHSRNAFKKWMTMWLQVIFYCILSTAVVSALNPGEIGKGSWLAMIVPFSSNQYWYFSSYSGLLFVMPFLDHIVQSIQKADLKQIFFGIGCILLIGSTSVRLFGMDPLVLKDGYSSRWLVILYLVGAIIKKTGWFQSASKKNLLAIGAVGLLFTWAWKLLFEKSQIEIAGINGDMWISYLSPTIVLAALVLLVIFSGFRRIP